MKKCILIRLKVDAFNFFEHDGKSHVAVLYGDGGTFCAGFDLNHVNPEDLSVSYLSGGPMGPSKMQLSKPVIAAIEGYAVAGGLELALWCDLRVMSEDAVVGVFCRRWGVPLIDGGTVRLPRMIGLSRALDLIITGRPVKADECHKIGLANKVVKPGNARAEAEKLASQIALFPQVCMNADRLSAYQQFDAPLHAALAQEFRFGSKAFDKEAQSGAIKFTKQKIGRHGDFEIAAKL